MSWVLLSLILAGAPPLLPVYPGAELIPVGRDLDVAGQHLWLAALSTDDPAEEVARFYAQAFRGAGLPVTVDGDCERACAVAGFRTREGLLLTAVLHREPGGTRGFLALSTLWADGAQGADGGGRGEVVSGDGLLVTDVRNGPGGSPVQTRWWRQSPDAVRAALIQRERSLGAELRLDQAAGDGRVRSLEWVAKGRVKRVWLSPAAGGGTVSEQIDEEERR